MSELQGTKRKDDSVSRWVCFGVGDQVYGLPILAVQEVLRDTEIEPVPGATRHVLGVLNLRGNVVTVIDLRVRLGLPPTSPDGDSRVVIVEHQGESFGLLVDRVADVRKIIDAAIKHAPDIGAAHTAVRVHGVYIRDSAVEAAAKLSARYISGRQLPDKAVDVLDTVRHLFSAMRGNDEAALMSFDTQLDLVSRFSSRARRESLASNSISKPMERR